MLRSLWHRVCLERCSGGTIPETNMTPEDWKKAWEIYQFASDLTGPQRESYLDKALENDPAIREEVARLLAENHDDEGEDDAGIEQPPATIGAHRLIRTIGE